MDASERVEEMAKLAQELKEADAVYEAEQARQEFILREITEARDKTLKDLNG